MIGKKNTSRRIKVILSSTFLATLTYSYNVYSATPLGHGIYYDDQQIIKLATKYPGRVSKDAGYPLASNYSTLKSSFRGSEFGLQNKAITTGVWWTPLLAIDKPANQVQDSDYLNPMMVIPNPLTVRYSENGIALGIPRQTIYADVVHAQRGFEDTLDILLTTGDLIGTAPLVADYSDWMVKVGWARNNAPLLSASLAEGSPFVFVEKKNNQPTSYLQFTNSLDAKLMSQTPGISLFKTKNAADNSYRYYAYFSNPNANNNPWKTSAGVIIVPISQGGTGQIPLGGQINTNDANRYFSFAIIPASSDSTALQMVNQFKPYAYTFINNTSTFHEYDKTKNKVLTRFNFETQSVYANSSLKKQPLVMLFPWQIKNLSAEEKNNCLFKDNCASDAGIIQTLKGTMHLFVPNTSAQENQSKFTIEVPFYGVLPALPNKLSAAELAKISSYPFYLPPDPHLDSKNPWTDTYATGKLLSREAQLIKIAHILMGSTSNPNPQFKKIRDDILKDLRNQMTSFLTGLNYTDPCPDGGSDCPRAEASWFFVYNNKWHSFIGFPSGFFTATTFTDHGFHWGYLMDAAATIAQFDKTWAKQYGGMVNLLIRDLWNYKYGKEGSEPTKFPRFRSFDPYSGLHSALGMPYSLDNINEEDSAEFMNLAQGIILWGLNTEGLIFEGDNTSSKDLIETGLYLYTTEEQGLNHYHFNQNPNSGVFPKGWSNPSTGQNYLLVGNVWGGKLDRSTYFCAGLPCYYQNLASNTMPISAGSFYFGYDPAFVTKVYDQDAKTPCSGDPSNSFYCATLLKYLALGDATRALQYYTQYFDVQNNIMDPGESKPSTYYWIQNLKNLGTLNTQFRADTPAFAVFGSGDKTYVSAFNHTGVVKNINFYKDTALACTLSVQPGEVKGTFCGSEPPPPVTKFSYIITLGYPFKPVLINNSITCPDPVTKNPSCLVKDIDAPSTMTIAGSNQNLCTLVIADTGGIIRIDDKSKGCYLNSQAATADRPGGIQLPAGF